MQNKDFIYYLFNKDKKALYLDSLGRVQVTDNMLKPNGQPAHLQHAPDGWRDTLVKYARNLTYLGIFRDFTVPMNFKKDGATILKKTIAVEGQEAIVYLGIGKLNRQQYPPKYEPWYTGELDFSKYLQSEANVNLMVVEGGLSKYFKAFENQTYEIPIDEDPQAELVVMDGLPFTNKIEYTIFDGQDVDGQVYMVGMGTISQEGSTQGILNQDVFFELTSAYPNDKWFMNDDTKFITVNITGQINIDVKTTGNIIIRIERVNALLSGPGAIVQTYILYNATHDAGEKISFDVNEVVQMQPNERLYLKALPNTSPSASIWYTIRKSSLLINYDVTFQQTIIKALKPIRLFQKLVEKMTDGQFSARSSYLNSMDDLLITSGSAIRNHEGQSSTVNGSIIKTSISEFFQAMKIRGVGLGVEGDFLVIERLKYFFRDDTVIELPEVSQLELKVAEDLEANTIKVGYPNQTYDNVNGLDEFNVTQKRTTPHTRIVRELDLVSPYRGDSRGIELLRVNLYGKDTTDNSSDNETFFLNVKKGGYYTYYSGNVEFNAYGANTIAIPVPFMNSMNGQVINITGAINPGAFNVINTSYLFAGNTVLTVIAVTFNPGIENVDITAYSSVYNQLYRPAYSSITGVLHPTKVFNTELSPHHNLLNNGAYLHSLYDLQEIAFIKFQTGEKNSELSTTLAGVTVTEKADVQIASLPAKLFNPYYTSFKVPTDFNFLPLVKANPYSKVSWKINGRVKKGYLFDGGVVPATREVQKISLLCAPETRLVDLIDEI